MAIKPARRRDIQVLRAVAVTIVVLAHLYSGAVGWGFVGVDLFFVISGYLVLGSVLRAVRDGESVDLLAFFARRFRRILPAALVVGAVTLIMFGIFINPIDVDRYGSQLVACAAFFGNFVLRDQAGGYFFPVDPSPFTHYWSLGVEEQFYVIVPPVVVLIALLYRRAQTRFLPPALLPIIVAGVSAASFALMAYLQHASPSNAFFQLPPRIWEFGLGGLAAMVSVRGQLRRWLALTGALLVAVASPLAGTGYTHLAWQVVVPTCGAALLLAAEATSVARWATPIVWIGDRSYSIYLWHWPLVVWVRLTWPDAGRPLWAVAAVLAGTLALSEVTYRLVEQPVRRTRGVLRRPVWALPASGVAVAVAVLLGLALPAVMPLASGRSAETAASTIPPATTYVPDNLQPDLRGAATALNRLYGTCHNSAKNAQVTPCWFGTRSSTRVVALVGDSHAAQWLDAFDRAGRSDGFRVVTLTKSSCPLATIPNSSPTDPTCARWRTGVLGWLARTKPTVLVLAAGDALYAPGYVDQAGFPRAVGRAWTDLLRSFSPARKVIVLNDTPIPRIDVPACLAKHTDSTAPCGFGPIELDRELTQQLRGAAVTAGRPFVDPVPWLCASEPCPTILGNILVYRDQAGHLTPPASAMLAPEIAASLRPEMTAN